MLIRRLLPLLVILLLAIASFGASQVAAGGGGDAVTAKKLPNCKKGNNKKKCRCPKGTTRKKNRKGYRCKKKVQPPEDENTGPDDQGGTDQGGTDDGGTDQGGTDQGGTDQGGTDQGGTNPPQPAFDPAKQFADIVSRMYLLRNYQVPKPGGGGYNNHSESYGFCNDSTYGQRARHYYEGIAYIYDTNGPWSVISGEASQDGTTGQGTIQYTQENANFNEEVGKVQTIQIQWQGDQALVTHPEIGQNVFAKSVASSSSCTRSR